MSTAAALQTHAAQAKPASSSPHVGLLLQRKCACGSPTPSLTGECAQCTRKKRLQTKLTVGASNDPLEKEADRVADEVLAAPAHYPVSDLRPPIQGLTEHSTAGSDPAPVSVDPVLASWGEPLEVELRQDMEQRFGHDFSRVRVHSGAAAEQSAQDVNAIAYTAGNHIVFNRGKFAPSSSEGKRLLAHELTHVVQQEGASVHKIARAPDPNAVKSNFTPQQQARLEQARVNQKADGTRIVGVLITPDGTEYEFISGGPGRFYAHIEGKAVSKMNELGIQKAVLLVEKEPCQTCDRSTYPYSPLQPEKGGPEVPLASSKTGQPLAREPSMINTGLYKGSELKVIDPVSSGIYRGLKTPPPGGLTTYPTPVRPTEADIKPSPPPTKAAPQDVTNVVPKGPAAGQALGPSKIAEPPGAPAAKTPTVPKPATAQSSAAKSPAPAVANDNAKSPGNSDRQRFSAPVGAFSRPSNLADEANARAQAKGNAALLAVQGVLAILTYFADKDQRKRADAAWAEVYPRIQEEITRTGRGVVVYVEYTRNAGSSVLIFEGIHWGSGGTDSGQPDALREPGQTAAFTRTYVGPSEAQASVTDETALIFRRDEARTKQRELQDLAELMAKEGWLGRRLRERAGDSISPLHAYNAKAHIVSASQSIKDKRYADAAASLDKADAAMDEMWSQIKTYAGEKKIKELRGEN